MSHNPDKWTFLRDLMPNATPEEYERAQENLDRYAALLLRIYMRKEAEARVRRLEEERKLREDL